MEITEVSHIAYSDESYYTDDRYRSVSVVTFESAIKEGLSKTFKEILKSSQVSEFKWNKLRQARERFAAIKMIDEVIALAKNDQIRVDVLIWDTKDSRHQIEGRDDIAYLQRMYYHLFKNVLKSRWPSQSTWFLYPDENSALDWIAVQDYLDLAGVSIELSRSFSDSQPFRIRLSQDFQIVGIQEVSSEKEAICQVADLFSGLGAFSHFAFTKYNKWLSLESGQLQLPLESSNEETGFTNSEKERFKIMRYLDEMCKECKFTVSLKTGQGFRTFDPKFPINFWIYQPQHVNDKAPTKSNG